MSSYMKAKFVVGAFRGFTSRILNRAPTEEASQGLKRQSYSSIFATNKPGARSYGLSCSSLISSRTYSRIGVKQSHFPFLGFGKRLYHPAQQCRPRSPKRWYKYPQNAIIVALVGSGLAITFYFANLETVPYTERKRFLLFSKNAERKIGEILFRELKAKAYFKEVILPDTDPRSIRVRLIARDIIEALEKGSTREHGRQPTPEHLKGINWEVIVVNAPAPMPLLTAALQIRAAMMFNAFSLPGGKIIVFTGVFHLDSLSDAEIATILGHEIAHVVARHPAELMTKKMRVVVGRAILALFTGNFPIFLRLPFSRRMNLEADYIGVLLMASAGYDPKVAPEMYEQLATSIRISACGFFFNWPESTRAEMLRQSPVMQEACELYEEVIANKGTEGIILRVWRKIDGIIH